jgi:hypothetical protein
MKRILLEDINYFDTVLEEDEENGKKVPYLLMDMMIADRWNANKRRYPLSEVKNAMPIFEDAVGKGLGQAIMLADHPLPGTPPSIRNAAGFIKIISLDEITKTVKGKVQLLDTEHGKTILAIVKAGGKVGISSRGVGELIETTMDDGGTGHEVKNLKLKGMDFVVFPSLGDASSTKALVYEEFKEDIQEEIKSMFPDISDKISALSESIESIKTRLESEDIVNLKNDLLESVMKLVNCNCEIPSSDVFIKEENKEDTQVSEADVQKLDEQTQEKEEIVIMKTISEFQEQYPELYAEVKDSITKELSDAFAKDMETKVVEIKESLKKEIEEGYAVKYVELETKVNEATTKIQESEKEFTALKEGTQPYIDILEGLVTFMREKGLLISEEEILKGAEKKTEEGTEEKDSEELKKLTDDMTQIINEQKAKIDEAIDRISKLEAEKTKLEEEKVVIEQEKSKAEIKSKIQTILSKEPKYAPVLQSKLEKASSMEEVDAIYAAEKAFIESVEKLNSSTTEVPTGEAVVDQEEVVEGEIKDGDVITESEKSPEEIQKSLKDYQRKLAGLNFKK